MADDTCTPYLSDFPAWECVVDPLCSIAGCVGVARGNPDLLNIVNRGFSQKADTLDRPIRRKPLVKRVRDRGYLRVGVV